MKKVKNANKHRPLVIPDFEKLCTEDELQKALEIGKRIQSLNEQHYSQFKALVMELRDLIGFEITEDDLGAIMEDMYARDADDWDANDWVNYMQVIRKQWVREELKEKGF